MATDETFTHDELVDVLIEAQNISSDDDGVRTGTELVEDMGVSKQVMLRRVKAAIAAGRVEVAKTKRLNVLGVECTVRGYRLK